MLAGNGAKVNCFGWRKEEKKAGLKISSYIPNGTVTFCCHIYDAPVYGLCAPFSMIFICWRMDYADSVIFK